MYPGPWPFFGCRVFFPVGSADTLGSKAWMVACVRASSATSKLDGGDVGKASQCSKILKIRPNVDVLIMSDNLKKKKKMNSTGLFKF
mmetsp:Transcript_23591/g.46969  ORF Transcript_23591/g.46969 Transcript_23591/m.46969 type:complete len:87 (-) Transcript_23591:6-266(-)